LAQMHPRETNVIGRAGRIKSYKRGKFAVGPSTARGPLAGPGPKSHEKSKKQKGGREGKGDVGQCASSPGRAGLLKRWGKRRLSKRHKPSRRESRKAGEPESCKRIYRRGPKVLVRDVSKSKSAV